MITSKVLMINVNNELSIGYNNAIEVTVEHQVCVYELKDGGIGCDIDFIGVSNVKFMGIAIPEGYKAYKEFKEQMLKLGIDLDELLDEACVGIISEGVVQKCKKMFKDIDRGMEDIK